MNYTELQVEEQRQHVEEVEDRKELGRLPLAAVLAGIYIRASIMVKGEEVELDEVTQERVMSRVDQILAVNSR